MSALAKAVKSFMFTSSRLNPEDLVEMIKMPFDQYLTLPTNLRQRDTEANAKKVMKSKRFDVQEPTHTIVYCAEDREGNRMLIDGHTRQYLMGLQKIRQPVYMNVIMITVEDLKKALELYTHCDSVEASETSTQKAIGAMRELKMKPKYPMIQKGYFLSALAKAGAKGDIYKRVSDYKNELMVCDELKISRTNVTTGIFAAMILTIKENEVLARTFWEAYLDNRQVSDGVRHDGVGILMQEVATRRREARITGDANITDLAKIALWCYTEWCAGRKHSVAIHNPERITFSDFVKA